MIKDLHGKLLRYILAAGAFLAVLATAGCASFDPLHLYGSSTPEAAPAPQNDQPTGALAGVGASAPSPTGMPNAFGEMPGVLPATAVAQGSGGFQQQTFLDEGYDADVNIDPTGKWMVFASTRNSTHPNLYLQRVDGLSVIELTDDDADYAYPVFSPDGKHIAFASTRGGGWNIYIMDTDGRNVTQVTSGVQSHIHPSYSPDGSKIVCSCLGGRSGQWELWTVDLTSGEQRMIGFGLFPTWSPNKSVDQIAFQRARQRGERWFSLWTLDLVEGEARRQTEVAISSNAAVVSPTWSPDGQHLVFATIAQPTDANPNTHAGTSAKPTGQQDIWTVDPDGSNRHRLTDGLGENLSPCWATDNRVYFISDRSGNECVWSLKIPDAPGAVPKVAATPKTPDQTNQSVGTTN